MCANVCVKPFIKIRDENTIVEAQWQEITTVHKKRLLQYHFPNHILHTHTLCTDFDPVPPQGEISIRHPKFGINVQEYSL
jgi:hypothetical protein